MEEPRLFTPRPHGLSAAAQWHVNGYWSLTTREFVRTDEGPESSVPEHFSLLSASELLDVLLAVWWDALERPG